MIAVLFLLAAVLVGAVALAVALAEPGPSDVSGLDRLDGVGRES